MTIKAEITTVAIGSLAVQGLMSEIGEFGVAVPQITECFQIDKNQASRDIKALLGEGFQFDKWRTSLNPKAVNVVSLEAFEKILFELALAGNPVAIDMSRAMIGMSLKQLFSDAFNVKFDADDRQAYLVQRMKRVAAFFRWTDCIKDYQIKQGIYGTPEGREMFADCVRLVNRRIFGQPHFHCNRDTMTMEQQIEIESFETLLRRKYTPGSNIVQVINHCLDFYAPAR